MKLMLFIGFFFYLSMAKGQNWEQLPIPFEGNASALGFHIVDDQKMIIEYSNGSVYSSNNLGSDWAEIQLGTGCQPQMQVWNFYDPLNGFLSYNCGSSTSYVLKTNDGGTTWESVSCNIDPHPPICFGGDQFGQVTKVCFTDSQHGFSLSNWGTLLTTTNGAQTWQNQCWDIGQTLPPGVAVHFSEIALSGNNGFLLANDAWSAGNWIFRTSSGGASWADWTTFAGGLKGRYYRKVYFHGNNSIFICGTAGKVIRSFDGGNTFDTITTSPAGDLYNMKFFDSLNGMMVGAGEGNTQLTFRSVNGGISWFQANVPGYNKRFYWIEQGLDGTVYLGGELSADYGFIFKSDFMAVPSSLAIQNTTVTNGQTKCYNATQTINVAGNGTTFTVQNGGSATMIAGQDILFLPGTSVDEGGYMWGYITPNSQYCGTKAPSAPTVIASEEGQPITLDKSSIKIYPNPTTANFILELTGEFQPDKMQMDIYNIWGEKVLTATLNGEKKHEFSLSDKATGVYFIRMIFGDKTESLKIIKQ
ncbi:MAG: T9SS type A sorting domain-containing protein [Bacteroidota bacterium]